jgi:hypothetical protein
MTENQEIPAENMPAGKNKAAAIILAIVAVIL